MTGAEFEAIALTPLDMPATLSDAKRWYDLYAEARRARESERRLLDALRRLACAVDDVRHDLGTGFPALAEAASLGFAAIAAAESKT